MSHRGHGNNFLAICVGVLRAMMFAEYLYVLETKLELRYVLFSLKKYLCCNTTMQMDPMRRKALGRTMPKPGKTKRKKRDQQLLNRQREYSWV